MANALQNLIDQIKAFRKAGALAKSANTQYQQGNLDEAEALYRQSLEIRTKPVVLYNYGLVLYKMRRKIEARTQWERVVELTEGRNAYLCEQARIALRQFG